MPQDRRFVVRTGANSPGASADVYPRFGPTMEWDVAAGDCVFRFSGRESPRFSPLRYNKEEMRNQAFVIGLDR